MRITQLSEDSRTWLVRADVQGAGFEFFNENSLIGLMYQGLGTAMLNKNNYNLVAVKNTLKNRPYFANRPKKALDIAAKQIELFINISVGDTVIVPTKGSTDYIGGIVTSDLTVLPDSYYPIQMKVKWKNRFSGELLSSREWNSLSSYHRAVREIESGMEPTILSLVHGIAVKGNSSYVSTSFGQTGNPVTLLELYETIFKAVEKVSEISGDDAYDILRAIEVRAEFNSKGLFKLFSLDNAKASAIVIVMAAESFGGGHLSKGIVERGRQSLDGFAEILESYSIDVGDSQTSYINVGEDFYLNDGDVMQENLDGRIRELEERNDDEAE